MPDLTNDEKARVFDISRKRLFGIAYRMLGTIDDAEDVLQEAYIRWHGAEGVETPEAWLVTVVTRLSIDRLRKLSAERETYIGPWLPEPLITSAEASPEEQAVASSDLSLVFMALLERLSPVERAVFLLHDIFDIAYAEIAGIVGKSEAAVRQMIHRSRERVRRDRPRFEASKVDRERLMNRFTAAVLAGDEKSLLSLFSADISLISDGGGKVTAARKVIYGRERLVRLFAVTAAKFGDMQDHKLVSVNGEIGILSTANGHPVSVTTVTFDNERITGIYRVLNPEKLRSAASLQE